MKDTQPISETHKKFASLLVLWLIVAGSWKSVEVVVTLFRWLFH